MKDSAETKTVLLMAGSTQRPSRSQALMNTAVQVLNAAGARAVPWTADSSMVNADYAGLREVANAADAAILCTPLYHSSFSGTLKLALDHLDVGHLSGKPIGLMSTAGSHSAQAIDHLRIVVGAMRAVAIPNQIIATDLDFTQLDDQYELTSPHLIDRMSQLIEELLWFIDRLRDTGPEPWSSESAVGGPADSGWPAGRWSDTHSGPPKPWGGQLSQTVTRAVAFIQQNYARPELSLDLVADEVHMSRYHFSRTFRAQTGRRFIDFITMLRLSNARTLLAQTERTITTICLDVGYRDLSHFERTFKKWFKMAPSEYRAKYRVDIPRQAGSPRTNGHRPLALAIPEQDPR